MLCLGCFRALNWVFLYGGLGFLMWRFFCDEMGVRWFYLVSLMGWDLGFRFFFVNFAVLLIIV